MILNKFFIKSKFRDGCISCDIQLGTPLKAVVSQLSHYSLFMNHFNCHAQVRFLYCTQYLDNELNHIKSTFIVYSDDPYNFPARKEVSCRNPQVKW